MNEKRKIVKHTGILMGMELGTRMLDIIISMIVARYLGPKGFGLLAFALSFGALFSIIPGFGMGTLVIRDVSRDRSLINRYLIHGNVAKLILGAVMLVLMDIISTCVFHSPQKVSLALMAGLLVIMESNIRFGTAFFQAFQMMKWVAVINLAIRLGWVFGSLSVMGLHGSVIDLIGIRCLINFAGYAVSVYLISARLQKFKWEWDFSFIGKMLVTSFPFALFRLFGTVYTDVDTVMLSAMRGDIMTGWYAAAQKFYRVLTFIPSSFAGTMLPLLSSYSHDAKPKFASSLKTACKYLIVIALPVVAVGFVMAFDVIHFFYGKAFIQSAQALRILMLALPFAFLNEVLISAVASLNREQKGSNILLMGALASGLSNLAVIPPFGHIGAAITTGLAEATVFFLQMRVLRRDIPGFHLRTEVFRPLLAALGMAGILRLAQGLGLVPAVLISVPAYVLALFLLRVMSLEDFKEIKALFQKKLSKGKVRVPAESPAPSVDPGDSVL